MKRFYILIILCTGLLLMVVNAKETMISNNDQLKTRSQQPRNTVLVELFTSEGCSSCPPADTVLAELSNHQPIANTDIVVLSEHIDYWDRLGWKDPYSSNQFSDRQYQYAQTFGTNDVYTPQMIVNGQYQLLGSDKAKALEIIIQNANTATAEIKLSYQEKTADTLQVHYEISNLPASLHHDKAEIMLAVTEDKLQSQVIRGENAGRKLPHTGVVRKLSLIGQIDKTVSSQYQANIDVPLASDWQRNHLGIVIFLQNRSDRRVLGVASTKIN